MEGDTLPESAKLRTLLPVELDAYVCSSIAHLLEPCACRQQQLELKLSEAQYNQRQLQLQVHELHCRLREADSKYTKAREEASLNAQALKRQVADGQKLADRCKVVMQECVALTQESARLENECKLYHNDREVFMEAADEAEERAAAAEERALAAERRILELVARLESLQQLEARLDSFEKPNKTRDAEDVATLQLRLQQMEEKMLSMQVELENVKADAQVEVNAAYRHLDEQSTEMNCLLTAANQQYEEALVELRTVQEAFVRMEATHRDEQTVHMMVTSAITSGMCKALEDEKNHAIESLNSRFRAVMKRFKGNMRADRDRLLKRWNPAEKGQERMKVAEKGAKALLVETQALRHEMVVCSNNLDKAENEVQLLADENKELWLMLRAKYPSCSSSSSPTEETSSSLSTKVNCSGMTTTARKVQVKLLDKYELRGQDSSTSLVQATAARSPLTPLRSNSPECRLHHR